MSRPYLIVTGDFVPTGGMDRANYALADYLARGGNTVHLVTHRVAEDLAGRPNVAVHRVPKVFGSYFFSEPWLRRAGTSWAKRVAGLNGRVVVNGGNCPAGDVNWVHYVHAAYRPVSRLGLSRRLKACWAHRSFMASERKALSRARLVLANSELTRRQVIDIFSLDEKSVRTVYYGIDPERFRPLSPEERAAARARLGWPVARPVAVFVGALGDRRKGFDTLFAAWRLLCGSDSWDADLVVIGGGAELPSWRERARQAGLDGRVRFLGFRRDVHELLPVCDVLAAPTRYEAYGLGVHEALCSGVPAVVSQSAGVAERYPPGLRDLLLSDPDDAAALAGLLRAWRERAGPYEAATRSLAASLREYTWDDMAARIVELMETAA